jgi:tRNA-dihydrouridine synthase B
LRKHKIYFFHQLAIFSKLLYIFGMKIGNLTIEDNLLLAPLAGISNRAFRMLARKYGASMCYTEMISSEAIIRNQKKTFNMIDIDPDEHPVGVQLFGSNPASVAKAVRKVQEFGPDLIDLNLGCPVKKVIRKNGGAALLKNITLAGELMSAAVENSTIPITIKIRTGWDSTSDVYLEIGKMAEQKGVLAITLHPRSRTENYMKKADWSKIAILKKEVSIPVIGNGDVNTPLDAENMFGQTGCDAIMLGRAAMRNPYIFRRIKVYLSEGNIIPDLNLDERIELALEHTRLLIEQFGDRIGPLKMRKHLAWYSKGFPGGAKLRRSLKGVESYNDICTLFSAYKDRSLPDPNEN